MLAFSPSNFINRHEARDIFRNAVNASEHDAVIFAGHGCTGAVHKLIHGLQLAAPPVVFVGPCEHHSNLLPWREVGALIVRIPEDKDGFLDLNALRCQLEAHAPLARQMIGCFSAASNITGVLADDIATTLLLHQYGALAFWDYATAGQLTKNACQINIFK
jgi:selenocysteine lyase/cysteine desulfurase